NIEGFPMGPIIFNDQHYFSLWGLKSHILQIPHYTTPYPYRALWHEFRGMGHNIISDIAVKTLRGINGNGSLTGTAPPVRMGLKGTVIGQIPFQCRFAPISHGTYDHVF